MTRVHRRPLTGAGLLLVIAVVVAACGAAAGSATPTGVASVVPTASVPATTGPTSTPASTMSATPAPTVAPSVAACDPLPQTGQLPSDRFTDIKVSTGADADRLTFVFGDPSLPGPAGPPQGSLEVAEPPFTKAGSGAAIAMTGQHVVQVRFTGMSLANDVGQPTYAGPTEMQPDGTSLRQAVLFDASEGVVGWYVGYDGAGCLSLVRVGNQVTLVIEHG